jgi:hypothetical protein
MDGCRADLPLTFERNLYQAVIRYKAEHKGALEERTNRRNEREKEKQSCPMNSGHFT